MIGKTTADLNHGRLEILTPLHFSVSQNKGAILVKLKLYCSIRRPSSHYLTMSSVDSTLRRLISARTDFNSARSADIWRSSFWICVSSGWMLMCRRSENGNCFAVHQECSTCVRTIGKNEQRYWHLNQIFVAFGMNGSKVCLHLWTDVTFSRRHYIW